MDVLQEIARRRMEQDARHGGASHDDKHTSAEWLAIVARYMGRASDASPLFMKNPAAYRQALVDAASVLVAAIESHDRKGAS